MPPDTLVRDVHLTQLGPEPRRELGREEIDRLPQAGAPFMQQPRVPIDLLLVLQPSPLHSAVEEPVQIPTRPVVGLAYVEVDDPGFPQA